MSEVSLIQPSIAENQLLSDVLQSILESRAFEKAPALRALLTYLWNNRHLPVSEYAIATEALGRSTNFDARTDATVRVQIGRLRQRLERFYDEEGGSCRERLTIPLGSHQLQVERMAGLERITVTAPAVVMTPVNDTRSNFVRGWLRYFWPALALLLLLWCGVQARQIRSFQKMRPVAASPWFWQAFFENRLPTRVVLPTPVFFAFDSDHEGHTIMFRDTEVNEYATPPQSALFRSFVDQAGTQPTLADSYTVTSDTFASVQIARYLDGFGLRTSVNSAAEAPMEALDEENVIAVGTWGTLTPLKPYLDSMDFQLSVHETSVQMANPLPGEPSRIQSYNESGQRVVWPGVIAVLPGMNGRTHLLVLAGRYTTSLVSLLTSTVGLNQLEKMWREKGSPKFFQTVVKAELNGGVLQRVWPVALHPFKGKA